MTTVRDGSASSTACPHWSRTTRNCLLCKGGLFLPVAEHVATYCQTGNFTSCPQFLEAMTGGTPPGSEAGQAENRRRYERIPARLSFRLSEFLAEESLENLIDDSACTVDLSPGGIRFESHRCLSVDSLVRFFITDESSINSYCGTGRVRWCCSLDKAPLFHVGVAFADNGLAPVIRKQIGLHRS